MFIFGKNIGSKGWMLEAGHRPGFVPLFLWTAASPLRFAGTPAGQKCALVPSSFITNNQLGTVT